MTPASAAMHGPATATAGPEVEAGERQPRRGLIRVGRSWIAMLAVVAAVVMLRAFVVSPARVSSDSMAPTLSHGAVVLVDRLSPHVTGLHRGELVVFHAPGSDGPVLKRLVATGGDVVEIRDAYLFVNGRRLPEPQVDHERVDGVYFGPVQVPAGQLFVLGDNRANSEDSADYGPLDEGAVIGRAVVRVWPPRGLW
jgi:signal peptidase I